MPVTLIEGFNTYDDFSQLKGQVWTSVNATAGLIEVGGGRYIGNALKLGSGCAVGLPSTGVNTETDYHRVGFSFKFDTAGTGSMLRVSYYTATNTSSSNGHMFYNLNTDGHVLFYGADASLKWTSPAPVLVAGEWYYIELGWQTSSAGTMDLYVNGFLIHTMATDTLYGTSHPHNIAIMGSSGGWHFDDFYFATDTTMPPALGECRVETLVPNANTAQADFTGTVLDIDDPIGNHDGDTSYLSSATLNAKSEFDLESLDENPSVIHAVQALTTMKNSDVGAREVTPYIISGATQADDSGHLPHSGVYFSFPSPVWETDPNTAQLAWTTTTVNALKIGIEITI